MKVGTPDPKKTPKLAVEDILMPTVLRPPAGIEVDPNTVKSPETPSVPPTVELPEAVKVSVLSPPVFVIAVVVGVLVGVVGIVMEIVD